MKHTTTPYHWNKADFQHNGPGQWNTLENEQGQTVITWSIGATDSAVIECSEEDAAYIVRCCNSHDRLVAACKRVLRAMEWAYPDDCLNNAEQANILRAALAAAEGETP